MRISVAQLQTMIGDIGKNLAKHLVLLDAAIAQQADLVFFPELSLTGYEPKLAENLAVDSKDSRLAVLQNAADRERIVIGVGLPTRSSVGVRISMILLQPHQSPLTYSKQQLHADERPFFVQGADQVILRTAHHVIAPAICYESLQTSHVESAARAGVDVYLASVAKPARLIEKAYAHYSNIARLYSMTVFMANAVGRCDDFVGAGRSAIWNRQGVLVAELGEDSEGILLFDTVTEDRCAMLI